LQEELLAVLTRWRAAERELKVARDHYNYWRAGYRRLYDAVYPIAERSAMK
jgi:hypothetical protein